MPRHDPISELGASGAVSAPTGGTAGGSGAAWTRPPVRRSNLIGYALYFPAALMFSLNGTVSKALILGGLSATRASQFRVTAAFLILAVAVAVTHPTALRLRRTEIPQLLLYGVAGIAMTQWLYFVAISLLPVGVALLIEFTAPIMVVLWVYFAWHHPVKRRVWFALIGAMSGLALVGQVWEGFALDALGVAAGFGAAAALAIYYLTGERAVRERDPLSLTMWGFGAASVMWAVVTPWWTFPFATIGSITADIGPFTGIGGWWLAAYVVVLGTVVPFVLVLFSLRHLSAARASVIGMAEPLLAAAIAWALLGEVLTPVQLVGAVVVLSAVVVAESSR